MAFVVVLRRKAQADLAIVVSWLEATRGLRAADRWRTSFLNGVVPKLENNPHRFPQADEAADLGLDLRELLHGRRSHIYRVLFTIDGETVNVHRVRHAAQDRLAPGDV